VLLDGQPPAAAQLEHEPGADLLPRTHFDGYAPETYVGLGFQVGWPHLTQGRHTLTFECVGKREAADGFNLGVDNIVLARPGAAAWAAAAKIQPPRMPTGSVAEIGQALSDPDPVLRGLAAIALRDMGRAALPALPALIAALKDGDQNVRLMSANAIGAIGQDARDAVPALIAAGSAKDEHVQVLRSYATALGRIGKPAAVPAIPLLKELAKIARVKWAADAALKNLE